jgi:murein DD-endopeptidase MepM/ murein hydrolase activator NlpD
MQQLYKSVSLLIITLIVLSTPSYAQNISISEPEGGGEYPASRNDAAHPCISQQQYELIEKRMKESPIVQQLDNTAHKTTMTTTFSWPLAAANGLTDCNLYYIGNYVDQDPTSPGIKDYNCGTVTYDGHRGTDIVSAPYPFLRMDNNQLNAVAAAPGTIIQKSDGFFDKNCAMNSDTANYVIIQHADGSVALYWHLKKNSLTSKIVGQTVVTGEFLGVVGSSGSSTAPHLHFEVWSSTTSSTLQDPWTGTCNSLTASTLWVSQKPYTEPAILRAQVNKIAPLLPGCDTTETTNEDSCFTGGANTRFYIFIRNETTGDTAFMRIVNPGGSTFSSWIHRSNANYFGSYWYFVKPVPTTAGVYTFESIYNGITCSKTFKVNCATLGTPLITDLPQVEVSPNPANSILNVSLSGFDNGNCKISLTNIVGQVVSRDNATIENNNLQKTLSISNLPNGIYFLTIETGKERVVSKVIKQN